MPLSKEYDAVTQKAVEQIQAKYGVPVDGVVGNLTKIILYREEKLRHSPARFKLSHSWTEFVSSILKALKKIETTGVSEEPSGRQRPPGGGPCFCRSWGRSGTPGGVSCGCWPPWFWPLVPPPITGGPTAAHRPRRPLSARGAAPLPPGQAGAADRASAGQADPDARSPADRKR
ncbi:MAG: peptidoglycan-binding protein [Desulfosudis oleivorans]|nr:peptidoglycan-binding protein [Desulfosudis oleivorans]